jgi:hypothetical protein
MQAQVFLTFHNIPGGGQRQRFPDYKNIYVAD